VLRLGAAELSEFPSDQFWAGVRNPHYAILISRKKDKKPLHDSDTAADEIDSSRACRSSDRQRARLTPIELKHAITR